MTLPLDPHTQQRIEREARAAAHQYSDINDACPYPFGTAAAAAFKREFDAHKQAIAQMACPYPVGTAAAAAFKRELDAHKQAIAQMKERGR